MLNQGQETPILSTATASIFTVGALTVRPAPRELEGPGGVVALEPRVMQVFLVLSGAGTEVHWDAHASVPNNPRIRERITGLPLKGRVDLSLQINLQPTVANLPGHCPKPLRTQKRVERV